MKLDRGVTDPRTNEPNDDLKVMINVAFSPPANVKIDPNPGFRHN
jgi:hypothetical protein